MAAVEPVGVADREAQLEDIVLGYLLAVDAGEPPAPEDLLARHPHLATELRKFFADQAGLDSLLSRLRVLAPTDRHAAVRLLGPCRDEGAGLVTTGHEAGAEGLLPPANQDVPGPGRGLVPPPIPGYEVLGVLGQGGMGIVYKARQIGLNRVVALTMIRTNRKPDASLRARFQAEAQAVAQLDHPHIVRVYESGEQDGQPYFVLEFVAGGSLAQRRKGGPWPARAAAALVAQLADAIDYAHEQGIVHRDLKPANFLLTADGSPKIADFGLSKQLQPDAACLTREGDRVGTPGYMAPEQAHGRLDEIGPGTDIFGLGAILYELLTGRPPFQGDTVEGVLAQARGGRILPPRQLNARVPPALERICLKAMAAEAQQRYDSAAALGRDLRHCLRRQRRPALIAAGLMGLVALGAMMWLLLNGRESPTQQPAAAAALEKPVHHEVPPSPPDLAARARTILRTHCYRCHGENGRVEGGFNYVLDRRQLVTQRKMVVPDHPEKSRLLKRIVDGEMPPEEEKNRPSKADEALLREWIAAGAPDFAGPAPAPVVITADEMLEFISKDLTTASKADRLFLRYFTLTHLYNAGLPEDNLQSYRLGLAKLITSLSWNRKIVVPKAIGRSGTVLRIDLRDYNWSDRVWALIVAAYPYGVTYRTEIAQFCGEATQCPLPYVRADWFVAEASRPPLYHEVLQVPETIRALEKQLGVDADQNLLQRKVARAGFGSSGVSNANRLIERHESPYGSYWKSYDFGPASPAGGDRKNLFEHPLGPGPGQHTFQHDGGEIIFSLPNGLQGYMLADAAGKRIDQGPTSIVKDPRQPEAAVRNGISCMTCHTKGLIDKDDQIRAHVLNNTRAFAPHEAETILTLHPPRQDFLKLLAEDRKRFTDAVRQTGAHLSATEPVVALADRYKDDLDLHLAAAEVGVPPNELLRGLDQAKDLLRIFGALRPEGGTVKREQFTRHFKALVSELQVGEFFVSKKPPPPVPPPPEDGSFTNSLGMKLMPIAAGKFRMGSPITEPGRGEDELAHDVEISKPFYLGAHEVTQERYQLIMGTNPSHFSAGGQGKALVKGLDTTQFPVECVSWKDAVEFCRRLSEEDKEKRQGRVYRLPTEAEWEYAARAGSKAAYSFGQDAQELYKHAHYCVNSGKRPHPVGKLQPNRWGLYDMEGNVREWCADYYEDPQAAPAREEIRFRVLRGGSWKDDAAKCRCAVRHKALQTYHYGDNFGFRVAVTITVGP